MNKNYKFTLTAIMLVFITNTVLANDDFDDPDLQFAASLIRSTSIGTRYSEISLDSRLAASDLGVVGNDDVAFAEDELNGLPGLIPPNANDIFNMLEVVPFLNIDNTGDLVFINQKQPEIETPIALGYSQVLLEGDFPINITIKNTQTDKEWNYCIVSGGEYGFSQIYGFWRVNS